MPKKAKPPKDAKTDSALTRSLKFLLAYQSPADLHAKRCAGSTLPMHYVTASGWATQVGQQGGRPAVAVYKNGKLAKARYLTDAREPLADTLITMLPSALSWHGKRRNFRVIGQVRRGVFEALAVVMLNSPDLITNLDTDASYASGFVTPSQRRRMAKPSKKLSPVSVITTTYSDHVRIAWFHRERSKVLYSARLDRP